MPRSRFMTNVAISDEHPKSGDIVVMHDKALITDTSIRLAKATYNKEIKEVTIKNGFNPVDSITVDVGPYEYNSWIHYILRSTEGSNMIISYILPEEPLFGFWINKGKIWLNLTSDKALININYDGTLINAYKYSYYANNTTLQEFGPLPVLVRNDFKKILLWSEGLILEDEYGNIIRAIHIKPRDTETYIAVQLHGVVTDGSYIYIVGMLYDYTNTSYIILIKFDLDLNLVFSYKYDLRRVSSSANPISLIQNKILIATHDYKLLELDKEGNVGKVVSYDFIDVPIRIYKIVFGSDVFGNSNIYLLGQADADRVIVKVSNSDYCSINLAKVYVDAENMYFNDMVFNPSGVPELIVVGTDESSDAPNNQDALLFWVNGINLDPMLVRVYGFSHESNLYNVFSWHGRAYMIGSVVEEVAGYPNTQATLVIADARNIVSTTEPQIIDKTSSITPVDITSDINCTIIDNNSISKVPVDLDLKTLNIKKEDITQSILKHIYIGGD